jgi:uncharacterized protein YkwD
MARKGIGAVTFVAVVAALALMAPTASAKSCQGAAVAASQLSVQQAKGTALCLMNNRRAHRGLPRLRYSASLGTAAQNHSTDMDASNFFSHDSPSGSSPLDRITGAGYISGASSWGIGENIAWGSGSTGSPQGIVTMWMNSPAHREIMLSRSFRQVGIGIVIGSPDGDGSDGAIYTADFGYRR